MDGIVIDAIDPSTRSSNSLAQDDKESVIPFNSAAQDGRGGSDGCDGCDGSAGADGPRVLSAALHHSRYQHPTGGP